MNRVVATLSSIAFVLAVTTAAAIAKPHDAPGTPGDKNCKGQTMAFIAQGAGFDANGVGNVANTVGLTVQEVHAVVEAYCAGP